MEVERLLERFDDAVAALERIADAFESWAEPDHLFRPEGPPIQVEGESTEDNFRPGLS